MREKINGQSEGGHARVTEGDPRVGVRSKEMICSGNL